MTNKLIFVYISILAVMAPLSVISQTQASAPVVEVLVDFQEYDAFFPWQSNPARSRRGFGLMLDATRIITPETLVRNQTVIEIRRPRSGRKETARLLQADPQINLALLVLDSPFGATTPVIDLDPSAITAGTQTADLF